VPALHEEPPTEQIDQAARDAEAEASPAEARAGAVYEELEGRAFDAIRRELDRSH